MNMKRRSGDDLDGTVESRYGYDYEEEGEEMTGGVVERDSRCYQNGHVHEHSGLTSCNDRHCHMHPGVTGGPISRGRSHVHPVDGKTTYDDGHTHAYRTMTGLAVPLPNGYHTHCVRFTTMVTDGHQHHVQGYVVATTE
jgi:hypothetical protein